MLDRMVSEHYVCRTKPNPMNRLSLEKRKQIIQLLVEGNSIRSTSRVADASINTVISLLVKVGAACRRFHDQHVVAVNSRRIQCDEIWSFVYAKEKNKSPEMPIGAGDVWTWTAIDADTKLIIGWYVGQRDAESAHAFVTDIAGRLTNKIRMQLTTDGLVAYLEPIAEHFGSQIDFAQLVKVYGVNIPKRQKKKDGSIKKMVISGNPNPDHISTSFVERHNLTMRMGMRRFTRSTNAFSKKIENHEHAIALFFVYYNWVRPHKTLKITPAMAAGLTKRFLTLEELLLLA